MATGLAEAIGTALERLDKPAEYRLYAGEGHVLSCRANLRDFRDRRLESPARHLDLEMSDGGCAPATDRERRVCKPVRYPTAG